MPTVSRRTWSVPWFFIACAPFVQRFMTTCCSSVGSAITASSRPSTVVSMVIVAGSDARRSPTVSVTTDAADISPARRSLRRLNASTFLITALCAFPGGQDPLQVSTRTTTLADGGKRQLGVAKDGAEDVVELMRDPAGERSNGLEPLRLMQPRLKHLTLGLAALA